MEPNDTPQRQPAADTTAAEAQLQAWTALRDQMQKLHAELEYLKLMLTLGVR